VRSLRRPPLRRVWDPFVRPSSIVFSSACGRVRPCSHYILLEFEVNLVNQRNMHPEIEAWTLRASFLSQVWRRWVHQSLIQHLPYLVAREGRPKSKFKQRGRSRLLRRSGELVCLQPFRMDKTRPYGSYSCHQAGRGHVGGKYDPSDGAERESERTNI